MNIFSKKPYKVVEVGEWLFEWFYDKKDIRGCYLRISSKNTAMFQLRINGSSHAYGYLLAAAEQGLVAQLHGYIAMLYVTANALTQDQSFVDGVTEDIKKWMNREAKKAEKVATSTSDTEEHASQALMETVAAYADATPKERKKMRKQWLEETRETLREEDV